MTDPRAVFGRAELADSALKGRFTATRYAEAVRMRVALPVLDLHSKAEGPGLTRQALMGHAVQVLEPAAPVSLIRIEASGYVAYARTEGFAPWAAPTHRVAARQSFAFAAPDIKTPAPLRLSCGALVQVTGNEGRFAATTLGFIPAEHLRPVNTPETDPAAVAERLLGTPYLWGGDSADGIDCSGLVQLALSACGEPCPGDSDQQAEALGRALPPDTTPQRGDLFFWSGHVAMAISPDTLIHANAHHMAVAYEPIAETIARIEASGDGVLTVHKRLQS